ncbi:MAG: sugar kinase [Treponema sp.]|jgi:2-dehydro-3-deoxygluconokinase|nr:sugar kinase [Treponema sp.]
MKKRIVTFGEIMMRLNPPGYLRFVQADTWETSYAGGEANVAVSLAQFGMDAAFVTKLPSHEIGQCALNECRRYGVDTSLILRGGERLGLYFVEKGASQRAGKVIYDRSASAIALAGPGEFDWKTICAGAQWFHITGITPALSDNCAAASLEAVKTAKELGLTVSCDLNYRKKLWTSEKAGRVMAGLMPFVDLCIANEEDAADVFGIRAEGADVTSGTIQREGYVSVAAQLAGRFNFKKVAITLRGSVSASDNTWSAMLYEGGEAFFAPTYAVHIVDRVGGGDSFGAALIYSQLSGWDNQRAITFAAAASCLKHSIEHDFNLVNLTEVETLAAGNTSGRVQR